MNAQGKAGSPDFFWFALGDDERRLQRRSTARCGSPQNLPLASRLPDFLFLPLLSSPRGGSGGEAAQ
jgi:hypothetical protein